MTDIENKYIDELLSELKNSRDDIRDFAPSSDEGDNGDTIYVRKAFSVVEYRKLDDAWHETGNVLKVNSKDIFKERHGAGFPAQASIRAGVRSTGSRSHGGRGSNLPGRKIEKKGVKKGKRAVVSSKTRSLKGLRVTPGRRLKKNLK